MTEDQMREELNKSGYYLKKPFRVIYVYRSFSSIPMGTYNTIKEAYHKLLK